MASFDLRPRIVLYPPGGAIVLLVDPTSALAGTVTFPLLGAVPYDIVPGFPETSLVFHFPAYGEYIAPINLSNMSFGGGGTLDLPLLGAVPYALVIGPPAIPEEQLFAGEAALSSLLTGTWMPWVVLGGIALLAWRR